MENLTNSGVEHIHRRGHRPEHPEVIPLKQVGPVWQKSSRRV
jgi:hypothetical protein